MRPSSLPIGALALAALAACATPGPEADPSRSGAIRAEAVRTAVSMIGVPYRVAGRSPRGFDCSGLVVYSYGRAGAPGLPHSAAALERRARPVSLARLQPGDLLFFDLEGKSHVGIYVGDRAFVHAPSPGKRVERVSFDDAYWGARIGRAGRLAH